LNPFKLKQLAATERSHPLTILPKKSPFEAAWSLSLVPGQSSHCPLINQAELLSPRLLQSLLLESHNMKKMFRPAFIKPRQVNSTMQNVALFPLSLSLSFPARLQPPFCYKRPVSPGGKKFAKAANELRLNGVSECPIPHEPV